MSCSRDYSALFHPGQPELLAWNGAAQDRFVHGSFGKQLLRFCKVWELIPGLAWCLHFGSYRIRAFPCFLRRRFRRSDWTKNTSPITERASSRSSFSMCRMESLPTDS
jgi:hypothetical protein